MAQPRYTLLLRCPNGHETSTELLHPEVQSDGQVLGYAGSDADYCSVCQATPEAVGCEALVGLCEWFLLCEHPATTTRQHPILGAVPICDRCDAKVEALASV